MTDRYTAKATRLMPTPHGFIRVPAYVMAEPRKRGGLAQWLAEKRNAQ